MLTSSRTSTKLASLLQQYQVLNESQLKSIFPLFWTDDVEMCIFWDLPNSTQWGHLFHSGINTSLEPLPIASWLSRHDERVLNGKALFETTARERRLLISALLKKPTEGSPIRIVCFTSTIAKCREYVFLRLGHVVLNLESRIRPGCTMQLTCLNLFPSNSS